MSKHAIVERCIMYHPMSVLDSALPPAGMREAGERSVVLEDCDSGALRCVLHFCYAGECAVPRASLLPTLSLADRLDLPALLAACEEVPP